MATNNKIAVGLKLPLTRGNLGYFNQNFSTIDQAYSNIKNLLLTMVGERRMNVGFGSQLHRLLFEQITSEQDVTATIISNIQNLMDLYFPYVDVLLIDVTFPDNNNYRIDIDVTFRLKNSSNTLFGAAPQQTVSLTLNTNLG